MRKVLFILGELTDNDIEWMLTRGRKQTLPAGTTLITEGQAVDTLYIILEGSVTVLSGALGGKEVARLGAGEMVGEMSFIDARPPSATVKALEKAIVFAIPRPALADKLQHDLAFSSRFYRSIAMFLSDRLRGTVSRLGYNKDQQLDEDVEYADELDLNVLDNIYLAGARFDRMLKRLLNG